MKQKNLLFIMTLLFLCSIDAATGMGIGVKNLIKGINNIQDIYVLSDVEGSLPKLKSFVQKSNAFTVIQDDSKDFRMRFKNNNAMLVVTGDMIDKGEDSVKILKCIIDLAQASPGRVIIVFGNRDVNKLRLLWELPSKEDDAELATLQGNDEKTVQRKAQLTEALDMRGEDPVTKKITASAKNLRIGAWKKDFEAWIQDPKNLIVDGKAVAYSHGQGSFEQIMIDEILKLKFLLAKTFGAPDAFEFFKKEMGLKNDRETYENYIAFVSSGGLLARYLSQGNMAYAHFFKPENQKDKQPSGALFVHGGISKDSLGYVPESSKGKGDASMQSINSRAELIAWLAKLNARTQQHVKSAYKGDIAGALPLIEAQEPAIVTKDNVTAWGGFNKGNVIQERPWDTVDQNNLYNLAAVDQDLAEQVMQSDVAELLDGHSPVGEDPVMLKTTIKRFSRPFVAVHGDTSASNPPRNAAIKVTKEGVTIFADFYKDGKDKPPVALEYSSTDPLVGTSMVINGKRYWWITPHLIGHWAQPFPNAPFGTPTYHWQEAAAQ